MLSFFLMQESYTWENSERVDCAGRVGYWWCGCGGFGLDSFALGTNLTLDRSWLLLRLDWVLTRVMCDISFIMIFRRVLRVSVVLLC